MEPVWLQEVQAGTRSPGRRPLEGPGPVAETDRGLDSVAA